MYAASAGPAKGAMLMACREIVRRFKDEAAGWVQQTDGSSLLQHHLQAQINPERAFMKVKALLVESNVRDLWHAGKQNAKHRLQAAYSAVERRCEATIARGDAERGPDKAVVSTDNAVSEQADIYGSNGPMRVCVACLAW